MAKPDNLRLLARLLLAEPARYRPASLARLRLAGGAVVLRLTFQAPSPLGLGAGADRPAGYQPRARHCARCGRSAPSVVSLPCPG